MLLIGGGNSGLTSERAETWSDTVEFKPRAVPGLRFEAGWFNIDYRDRIGTPFNDTLSVLTKPGLGAFVQLNPTPAQVLALVNALPQAISNASGQPFDPAHVGAIVDGRIRNAAHEHAHGVDLAAEYGADLGSDEHLLVTATATYLDANKQVSAGQPFLPQTGVIFTPPHWRARAGIVYSLASAEVAAFVNRLGATQDQRQVPPINLDPIATLDLTGAVRTTASSGPFQGLEFRLSALNLLNRKPDSIQNTDPTAIPYDSTNQSAMGRFISFTIAKTW